MSKKNGQAPLNGQPADDEQAPKPDKIKRTPFERELRVILTPDQVAERADRLAHVHGQRDNRAEVAAAAAKHARSEIAEMEATIRRLSGEVRDKACYLPTQCERLFNYTTGFVTEVRTDTGEIISDRPMTPEERQMDLDAQPAGDKEPDEDGHDHDDELDDFFEHREA